MVISGLQPGAVEVQLDDGTWIPGDLQAIHRADGTWKGFVSYYESTNALHHKWFGKERVRGHLAG